ncbi:MULTISPECIES: type II toxin-antitoxin system HicA family toxin [Micrococcaceae]|uniref:type II toxin-antitoxin system HicA family toxin n=1 Tax=Micrococcaceae TaxID=1268 RepID=UPI000480C1F0|nr:MULTISPECIES: type II toxin-antitoxin system HicA family toxin [Micrococcaceae]MCY0975642.1 type II toxin-antitoxin system HicA family toxin [Paenarthrobacter ureafaciens]MDE8671027.1 type II toxin-antitoxin system HicA family toxin [Pseudarthrobacter sp. H3Y2-7]MDP9988596.1 putative RNA binding protein YcfA (HicA-like mRNA interferase family) [Arthrobacter oryzae]
MKEIKRKEAEAELTKAGWRIIRQTGKHDVWASPDGTVTVAVPRHRTISPGVVRQIAKGLPTTPSGWQ